MTEEEVAEVFAAHAPWITRFEIRDKLYGGWFDGMNDARLALFFATFPGVATILELGALEGGHTIGLARNPRVKRVVGIEGRPANLRRAQVAADLLEARNVEFSGGDLEKLELSGFGKFDAVFCCGLLYHLPEPWHLVQQMAALSPHLFLWTHYCRDDQVETTRNGYSGRMVAEGGSEEPLSGLSASSFWPTIGALVSMLNTGGFPVLHILSNDPTQTDGPAITIAAFAYGRRALPGDAETAAL